MTVNRKFTTQILREIEVLSGGVKMVVPQRDDPIWQTVDTNIEISNNCVCLITAIYTQEDDPSVFADLVFYELMMQPDYRCVMLEQVNLTIENPFYVFFEPTEYVFPFNLTVQHTAQGTIKRIQAGDAPGDLDVNTAWEIVDFLEEVAYTEPNNQGHVNGIKDNVYRHYKNDKINFTETTLPQSNPYTITHGI